MNALKKAGVIANGKNNLDNGSQSRYNALENNKKQPISRATRILNQTLTTPNAAAAPPPGNNNQTSANGTPTTTTGNNNNNKQKNDTKGISVEEWFRGLNGYSKYLVADKVFSSPGTRSLPLTLREKFFNPSNASGNSSFKNTNNTNATYPRIAELYACVFLALPGSVYGSSYVFTLKEDERRRFLTTKEFGDWFDKQIEPLITNGNRDGANTYMKGLIDHVMNTYDIKKSMKTDYTNSLTRARAERRRLTNMKGFANKNAQKSEKNGK